MWVQTPSTNDVLVTMGEVKEVLHSEKGVGEGISGGQSLISVDQQHGLQEVHKLPAVCFLSHLIGPLHAKNQIHLGKGGREMLTFEPRVRALSSI